MWPFTESFGEEGIEAKDLKLKIIQTSYEDMTTEGIEKRFNDWIKENGDDISIVKISIKQPYQNHVLMFCIWYKELHALISWEPRAEISE